MQPAIKKKTKSSLDSSTCKSEVCFSWWGLGVCDPVIHADIHFDSIQSSQVKSSQTSHFVVKSHGERGYANRCHVGRHDVARAS